jgi:hypothetical protein
MDRLVNEAGLRHESLPDHVRPGDPGAQPCLIAAL